MRKRKIFNRIIYILALAIGIPLGFLNVPDNKSILQCIWYPIIFAFFVACALMVVRGIFEEYFD